VDDNRNIVETIIPSTKPTLNSDGTTVITAAAFETNRISEKSRIRTTALAKFGLNSNDYVTTTDEVVMSTIMDVSSTDFNNLSNTATENDIIKVAESNRHYQIAPLQEKKRSLETNDNLPTFNVEFVVRKEDIRADCNQTRKRTIIKPDRILAEYPKNSGISIKLRELKKRKRRHLQKCKFSNTQYA